VSARAATCPTAKERLAPYPLIAGNEALKASGSVLDVVVNGKRAMPLVSDDEGLGSRKFILRFWRYVSKTYYSLDD
jgi:hypothetical protein